MTNGPAIPPIDSAVPVLGVLISGRGSNLHAIIRAIGDGRLAARVGVVISNRPDAGGLEHARTAGIPTAVIEHKRFESRAAFEQALVARLVEAGASVICLAGFMRILSPFFLERAPGPVLNVHPSLLPAFPGVDAQHQAWTHGVKVAGATVHLVTPELDAGPIVAQATVAVLDDDTPASLAARILVEEHRIYTEAITRVLDATWHVEGRRFVCRSR
ncbi:Phosphoribosylglycinamide formyltransferase [Luteitalea pratensis]|uniref:Phosphoribosylglycinamide formyltransferase n=1 Tax=Luteitalea pratensis TaxID=1855912 RepID=A0A143PGI0_LUTPR|nr:phosphoribosylglycinamide formyltransferase [Luteitalea pratensis]AMY07380.1 Phosphoribosylglycinamide formyltransferase [Luteitalea pratensis]